jgi:hypothetical protein
LEATATAPLPDDPTTRFFKAGCPTFVSDLVIALCGVE